MNTLRIALGLAAALALCGQASGAEESVKVKPLRDVPIEATSRADSFRNPRDREPYARDFVQQPPLIPHAVRGYNITANFNKCMDCHSWSKAKETGATKVSLTHFKDRDGKELSNISPRRYFCMQCHVPQHEAQPLVANTFKPVEALQPAGK
jgi:cytochrome c-type protein NapB